jgi:hypothetical protein
MTPNEKIEKLDREMKKMRLLNIVNFETVLDILSDIFKDKDHKQMVEFFRGKFKVNYIKVTGVDFEQNISVGIPVITKYRRSGEAKQFNYDAIDLSDKK